MKPASIIWLNGKVVPDSEAKIYCLNQGLNYGASVYEGIRCYKTADGPAIFRLKEHIKRFLQSAKALEMNLGYKAEEIETAIIETLKVNKIESGYIRPIAFYSESKMGINILDTEITFIIFVWSWNDSKPAKPTSLCITKYKRLDPDTINIKAKIGGYYVNGLLGFLDAKKQGYDHPLFLDKKGYITEGAISSAFFVKDGKIYTSTTRNILDGVTRDTVITIAKDMGRKVHEKDLKPEFLKEIDEAFLTGTGIQLQIVNKIKDHFTLEGKAVVTESINERYKKAVSGEDPQYTHWLKRLN